MKTPLIAAAAVVSLMAWTRPAQMTPAPMAETYSSLADAILALLDNPTDPERLKARAAEFSLDASVNRYLEVLLDLRCSLEQLEASLSLITALALTSQENKDVITLITQDHRGTYGKGHRSINELWIYLAMAQSLPDNAPPPPTASPGIVRLPGALEVHTAAKAEAKAKA